MRLWIWVYVTGSSVVSATTVASRDTRQQSVGVAVKHHAPTDASHTNRRPQDQIGSKKINRKVNFSLCRALLVVFKVLWQGSLSLVKVLIVSHHLARDQLAGMKFMKRRKEKIEELQRGVWYYERSERG